MSGVVVAGLGYVGLPLAMRVVVAGHDVTGYDTDVVRVKRLEAGESYVEDVPADELAAALESGRFRPSASADVCAGFDVAVITMPTPLRECQPDLGYVEAASSTTTPKIVSGIDNDSLTAVDNFYKGIVDRAVAVSSPREAELANVPGWSRGGHASIYRAKAACLDNDGHFFLG